MPVYHVHASYLKAGKHQGGARGFARDISREGRGDAAHFGVVAQRLPCRIFGLR